MKLVSAVPKRADAQREMRRQNGQRDTKFLFSVVVDDFFLERIILQNGSNGSDTNCGILPELHMGRLPGGPS